MGAVAEPQPGDRFIWEIPKVNFGPIYMIVKRVIKGQKPRVIFECWGPDGRPFRRPHRHYLPLPSSIRRAEWTSTDLMRARLRGQ